MAQDNRIDFKVRVTDEGLAPLASSLDKVESKVDELGSSAAGAGKQVDALGSKSQSVAPKLTQVAAAVAGVFAVDKLIDYGKSVNQVADDYKNLEARIRLAIGPNEDLGAAVAAVGQVATETFGNLDATAALYSRLAASSKELGISNTDALAITKTINQSIQVSGASAQASEASVRQLVQALQSGTLRGDEFNSIMEQAPRLAKALADGLGVPIGALRGMAEQGEITSARVVQALKGQADAINAEFASLPLTTGRAMEKLSTQWTLLIGQLTGGSQEASVVAQSINALAENLDSVVEVATRAGAVLTATLAVQAAAALRTYAAEVLAAKTATSLLTLEMSKVPKVIGITVAMVGFEAGFQIGQMLYENSELARKLGVGITEFMVNLVSDLQFLAEAAAAVFTDDTVGAAFDRYAQRAKEMEENFANAYEDAKNAPEPIAAAANQAAASATTMGAAAKNAGDQVSAAGTLGAAGIGKIAPAADEAAGALLQLQEAAKANANLGSSGIQLGLDLKKAQAEGKDLAKFLESTLPAAVAKLSGPELEKFKTDFQVAMQVANSEGKALDTGLRIIGERAAQSLGVDLVAAGTRVGAAFQASQSDLDTLIAALPGLKATGVDTGQAVGKALEGMVNGAKNNAEVEALRKRIESLRKVLGEKVADGLLEQLRKQAEEAGLALEKLPEKAKTHADRVAQAFKDSGIQTQAELDQVAKKTEENFFLISTSGKASAEGVQQAFKQMAEASIAANGGVASETLRGEAAMHGLEIATDRAGKTIVRAMGEGRKSADGFRDGVNSATEAVKEHVDWLDRMKERNDAVGKLPPAGRKGHNGEELGEGVTEVGSGGQYRNRDGMTSDASGKTLGMGSEVATLTGIKNFLQQAGLNEEQAKKLALEFSDSKGDIPYFSNPGQIKYGGAGSTMTQALLKAAERTTFGFGGAGGAAVGGGGKGESISNPTTTRHVVELKDGSRRRSFNAASAADASTASAILRELAEAQTRS